ncbi:MAG: deoxyribose-phosphate aldolase [Clostridiaceae bacterium]|jgi:deoxyribose-phosphate aldolase|nr:deoxyribose-phosphate aldolase [Clostridiaceae bacterium]
MDISVIERVAKEVVQEFSEGFDKKLAAKMEHSMIRPDATPAMVKQFCEEAIKYGFRNVSLPPCFVDMAASFLRETGVRVSTAVGFPMGISTTRIKIAEALDAIQNGAAEIDLPVNIGMVKAKEYKSIKAELDEILAAVKGKAVLKVVVDLGALNEEESIKVATIAKLAGADFLKIAATTRPKGVNAEDMAFFRQVVGQEMGLKADGGIKDYKSAISVIEAGGTTIGASGSVKIVTGFVITD